MTDIDKATVKAMIERAVRGRVAALKEDGATRGDLLREQGAFMAGAIVALQAVFGPHDENLVGAVPEEWIHAMLRGTMIGEGPKGIA